MFSNAGFTLGGFLCLILYGDRGIYTASWYIALFLPVYYLIGFPLIGLILHERKINLHEAMIDLLKNPVSAVPISVMCAGVCLNLIGVPRPTLLNTIITHYLSYITVAGYSFAIGLGLTIHKSIKYVKHSLFISLIKFIYNPLINFILLLLFGYFKIW